MTTTLPASLLLYRCPPLSAWMLKRQCDTNRGKAKAAVRGPKNTIKAIGEESIAALGLEPCITCRGVEALVEAGGSQPRPASDLRAIERTPEARGSPLVRREFKRKPLSIARNVGEQMRTHGEAPRISKASNAAAALARLGPKEQIVKAAPKKPPGTKYRNLYANNSAGGSIVYNRFVNGKRHQHSTDTVNWDEAAAKRDSYELEHGLAGKPERVKGEAPEKPQAASAPAAPVRPDPVRSKLAPPAVVAQDTVSALLAKLRVRRDALHVELSGVEQAILAVENAADVFGRPAA